ncbi:cytochrome d ubiquinol oxidase subunit II [Corynebacterium sanguinis]|uniref:cytochrome d ubiquinol oxidase subunit II n=1 Tax=Corynebacterium sanguinis TaxID=2594913 RepID=UPI0010AA7FEF|nr:cytochrome d ubiquinol oxidase subunit II [Corynebacterium sanguinis]MCT1463878.1 cytochrome d ubiquinol oxidase subunit II [Corynebacterium sanguinis]MCT1555165.1 cytochrome d ubiquinol oxidase subunit II [Corynebacterium sanguinis]MCT1598225.1 cytochrome d ubiquinol oxidase subunit II [Corynebacterium sanguinis]MCT1696044.1 cytochrome d ubiquinol oxidase subunit II [Corynebacterium sanguinis]MCT1715449.1 cytochrome d ubiquinol oxidase subunit II [Corynebacterium sanguinis]
MDLNTIWFLGIAVLFAGFFVLEGFDFGVGMLLPFVGGDTPEDNDRRRTAQVSTIGPLWDGNEVWLVTAAAAIFAAFPEWYATLLSGFFFLFVLILVGLIVRGVSLEWRVKGKTALWRRRCDIGTTFGSYLPAFLWGLIFTNLVAGVPLNDKGRISSFTDGFVGLFNPLGLAGGLAFVLLFALHGAIFVALKAHEPLRGRARTLALRWLAAPTAIVSLLYVVWLQNVAGAQWTWIAVAVAAVSIAVAIAATVANRDGFAFAATTIAIAAVCVVLFGSLFPDVIPSTSAHPGWDIYSAASNPYTLRIMSWAGIIILPAVIVAQAWSFWSFRQRVKV